MLFGAEAVDWSTITGPAIGTIMGSGIGAAFAWHMMTKTQPEMQKNFNEQEIRRISDSAKREEMREKIQSDNQATTLKAILAHCDQEAAKRDASFGVKMDVIDNTLVNLGQAINELTEVTRDLLGKKA